MKSPSKIAAEEGAAVYEDALSIAAKHGSRSVLGEQRRRQNGGHRNNDEIAPLEQDFSLRFRTYPFRELSAQFRTRILASGMLQFVRNCVGKRSSCGY
jgi:hypothetical protein